MGVRGEARSPAADRGRGGREGAGRGGALPRARRPRAPTPLSARLSTPGPRCSLGVRPGPLPSGLARDEVGSRPAPLSTEAPPRPAIAPPSVSRSPAFPRSGSGPARCGRYRQERALLYSDQSPPSVICGPALWALRLANVTTGSQETPLVILSPISWWQSTRAPPLPPNPLPLSKKATPLRDRSGFQPEAPPSVNRRPASSRLRVSTPTQTAAPPANPESSVQPH